MGSAHQLTEANIWPKFNANLSKGSGGMERTRKCYRRTEGQTDEGHFYNPSSASRRGIKNICLPHAATHRKLTHTNCSSSLLYILFTFLANVLVIAQTVSLWSIKSKHKSTVGDSIPVTVSLFFFTHNNIFIFVCAFFFSFHLNRHDVKILKLF